MSIYGGSFSFFFVSSQSYESYLNPNGTNFLVSKPNFPSVNLNTCYNNPISFSLTTISYLDYLQKCKPNDQDLRLINADNYALKPNANVTQKIKK
jgi:hypothetical protein